MIRKLRTLAAVVGVLAAGFAICMALIIILCLADAAGIPL